MIRTRATCIFDMSPKKKTLDTSSRVLMGLSINGILDTTNRGQNIVQEGSAYVIFAGHKSTNTFTTLSNKPKLKSQDTEK